MTLNYRLEDRDVSKLLDEDHDVTIKFLDG